MPKKTVPLDELTYGKFAALLAEFVAQAREEARLTVPPVVEKYSPGMLLVPRGQPIFR